MDDAGAFNLQIGYAMIKIVGNDEAYAHITFNV